MTPRAVKTARTRAGAIRSGVGSKHRAGGRPCPPAPFVEALAANRQAVGRVQKNMAAGGFTGSLRRFQYSLRSSIVSTRNHWGTEDSCRQANGDEPGRDPQSAGRRPGPWIRARSSGEAVLKRSQRPDACDPASRMDFRPLAPLDSFEGRA